MIVFFAFFYTAIVFNPKDTADNLKKYGGFVTGIRPGENTANYLDFILTRLTVLGALYLSFICLLPELLISKYQVPFYFGGTSLLIVVSVTMDTVTQIQSYLLAHQYEGLIKNPILEEEGNEGCIAWSTRKWKRNTIKILVEKHDFIQLSTGDLLREKVANKDSSLGKEISEIMNSGDLVPDNIVIQLIVEKISELKEKKSYI